ncbi:hypothetical protein [Cypionkella sp.]
MLNSTAKRVRCCASA